MTAPAARRRTLLAAVLVALLAASALTAWLLTRGGNPHAAAAPVSSTPAAPAPTPSAGATSAPPPRPAIPHDVVPPAVPTAFTLTGARFTIRAHVCAMANVRPYDPPGEQRHTICWVRNGFGDRPASRAATSYLFGHSWAEDRLEVLNRASAPVTREILHEAPQRLDGVPVYPSHVLDGYRLELRTRTGTLTYAVRRVYAVRKALLGGIASWEDTSVRDRVVLTTCAELGGRDYDYNVVIEAYLTASRRR